MRQLGIAALCGILGTLIAGVLVWLIAINTRSISERWLFAAAVFPILGIALGAALSNRISGAGAWPVTGRRRILFALLGSVLAAFTCYQSYVLLSAIWNGYDFWPLLLGQAALPELSSSGRGAASAAPVLLDVAIGIVIGAWCTDTAVKKKWL